MGMRARSYAPCSPVEHRAARESVGAGAAERQPHLALVQSPAERRPSRSSPICAMADRVPSEPAFSRFAQWPAERRTPASSPLPIRANPASGLHRRQLACTSSVRRWASGCGCSSVMARCSSVPARLLVGAGAVLVRDDAVLVGAGAVLVRVGGRRVLQCREAWPVGRPDAAYARRTTWPCRSRSAVSWRRAASSI
jgi:hypothetical protein